MTQKKSYVFVLLHILLEFSSVSAKFSIFRFNDFVTINRTTKARRIMTIEKVKNIFSIFLI